MGGNGSLGAVPLIGQQQAAPKALGSQLFLGMYSALIPQLAMYRVSHGYAVDGGLSEVATPRRIAKEAHAIAHAAMVELGFGTE